MNRLADDILVGCINRIILVNPCMENVKHIPVGHEMHDKINTLTRMTLASRAIKGGRHGHFHIAFFGINV